MGAILNSRLKQQHEKPWCEANVGARSLKRRGQLSEEFQAGMTAASYGVKCGGVLRRKGLLY